MNHEVTAREIDDYINRNPVMVVGTISENGMPHGAAVYGCSFDGKTVYFITKADTQKFHNITRSNKVSITIVNPEEDSTLQADGHAAIIEDADTIGKIMKKMTEIYAHSADWLPPIAKLRAGPYEVIGVAMDHARIAHYQGAKPGSERIFR